MSNLPPVWVHRFAVLTAFSTLLLLCAGALVTGTGSGLAVPDWPLSYGQFFPPMVGGVLYEHGHRLVAGTVALMMVGLSVVLFLKEPRRWVRFLGFAGVLVVLTQAMLGGLTVLFLLPKQISIAHACLAQIFFSITLVLALVTSRSWVDIRPLNSKPTELFPLHGFALGVSLLFFIQLLLGATVRHYGAGLAIPDFPTAFGGVIPPGFSFPVSVHFAHRVGAFTLAIVVGVFAYQVLQKYPEQFALTAFTGMLASLVAFQILLGASVIWLKRMVFITTIHLAVGALCLGVSVVLTFLAYRLRWERSRNKAHSPRMTMDFGLEPA